MHTPYETARKHPADFKVKYRFLTEKEGGRKSLPHQGIRSDFQYEFSGMKPNEMFMIWPEFEDENGEIILEDKPVPIEGTALMWILLPERRPFHYDKVRVGLKGYMMEGPHKTAECEVIEIIGLLNNPTSR